MNAALPNRLFSIGAAAGKVGVMVKVFRDRATEIGVEPVIEIDGVPHFAAEQVDKIETALTPPPPTPLSMVQCTKMSADILLRKYTPEERAKLRTALLKEVGER